MTINIAIAVAEGLVMAADSMSQMQVGPNQVAATHGSVEKLTEIGNVPIAAMAHGLGAIGGRTILSLVREFEFDQYQADNGATFKTLSVLEVTQRLADFIGTRYDAAFQTPPPQLPPGMAYPPPLGIVVGGYSPGEFFPAIARIEFPGKVVTTVHPIVGEAPGAARIAWFGMTVALDRLITGADLRSLAGAHQLMTNGLPAGFVIPGGTPPLPAPANVDPATVLANYMPMLQMPNNLAGMPLEEATEFADFLGMVSIGYDRFTTGPPAVGGELDVLAIQPEGLAWYRRKKFAAQMAAARKGLGS